MLLLYPSEQSVSRKVSPPPPPPQEKYLYQTLKTLMIVDKADVNGNCSIVNFFL